MVALTISLSKKEEERLNRLAIRYGLSLPEFSRHILKEIITSKISDIPYESLDEYENPKEIKESLKRAYRDLRAGRVHTRL